MYRIAWLTNSSCALLLTLCVGCQAPSPSKLTTDVSPAAQNIAAPAVQGMGDAPLPYYNTPDFSPHFLSRPDSVRTQITHRIKHSGFEDQDGIHISDRSMEGKIHVANFMFTSCGSICPVMTGELHKVARAFRNNGNVVLLSYSVMPWVDDQKRLQQYRQQNGIDSFPQWHFLTGNKARIYDLARRSYFAEEAVGYSRDSSEFLHTEHLLLVDGDGRIRGIYNGTLMLETEQLIKDIRALLKEKEITSIAQENKSKRI